MKAIDSLKGGTWKANISAYKNNIQRLLEYIYNNVLAIFLTKKLTENFGMFV